MSVFVCVVRAMRHAWRGQVLEKLRIDKHAAQLRQLSLEDVPLGRLTGPVPMDEVQLKHACVATRFGVEQGWSARH